MKLYYAPGTCSLAPTIVAIWAGIDLEFEKVDLRNRKPSFYKVNPMGAVPTLELDNGRAFSQVDAVINYLSALKPGAGLGGNNDLETFELNQWNSFLGGDFHPAFKGIFGPANLITDASDSEIERVTSAARANVGKVAKILNDKIGDSGHVVLGRRTMVDAHAFAMIRWVKNFPDGLNPYPNLVKFMETMGQDAGVQAAMAIEKR
jgi:glutathione S-transferase